MLRIPHRSYLIFSCVVLFLTVFSTQAQETETRILLTNYLQQIEADHTVKFSYVDADISTVKIAPPKSTVLQQILKDIEVQTQLSIQKLDDRYYTITKNKRIAICALVFDNFEENTLPGATVEVLNTNRAMVTNSEGYFSFQDIPRDAVLQIKYVGYKTLFVKASELAGNSPCKTLLLASFYQQLEEVVVYKFLTTGLIKQADASILLNTAEFGILPGSIEPDVLQSIQALPGVKSIDETVSDINIRGGSNDQNLLLWDGIKMYQSGHFFGLISAFNPYLTEDVLLIKNGASATYGDGVSGIIDMRTKDDLEETFFGGAGFNLISGDLYAQVPLGSKLALQISGRRSMTDIIDTPTYIEFSNRAFQDSPAIEQDADFYFYDFSGKLLYDINQKHRLRFSYINIANQLNYSELNSETNEATNSRLDQKNSSFGSKLMSEWNKKFSSQVNLYHTVYTLDAGNVFPDPQLRLVQVNKVKETGLKLATNLTLAEDFSWLNGYQLTETGITNQAFVTQPPFESDIKRVMRAHSVFSEISYRSPDRKLYTRGGLRFNYFQNPELFQKRILEPRLTVNYTLARGLKAIAQGEFKSQTTNQVVDLEQNFLGVEKRRWIIADGEDLPITTSKQGAVGINYDQKQLYVGLEAFFKEVKGVSTATQGFQNQNQFNGEIGQYDVKGIEFLINKKTDDYSIWGSYTYNFNNYYFPTAVPPEFPNNLDVRHTATLAATYTRGQLKLSLGLNYRSGKPFTEPSAENPIDNTVFPSRILFANANSSRLPDYLRADFSAVYDFELMTGIDASVGASVLNFTDRRNVFNTYYRLTAEEEIEKIESTSLGLTPNFSFRVRF